MAINMKKIIAILFMSRKRTEIAITNYNIKLIQSLGLNSEDIK